MPVLMQVNFTPGEKQNFEIDEEASAIDHAPPTRAATTELVGAAP